MFDLAVSHCFFRYMYVYVLCISRLVPSVPKGLGGRRGRPHNLRMADDAAPAVFKKPARKANMRKRKVQADADVDAGEAGEASGGPRCAVAPRG